MIQAPKFDLETVARILDPVAWAKFDFRQAQARACVTLGHEDTATLWIEISHEATAPSLAKAAAIMALHDAELARLKWAVVILKGQAEQWAMEARAHKSSLADAVTVLEYCADDHAEGGSHRFAAALLSRLKDAKP